MVPGCRRLSACRWVYRGLSSSVGLLACGWGNWLSSSSSLGVYMGVDLGLRVCRLSVSSGFAGGNIFAGGEMGNSVVVVCRAFAGVNISVGGELFSPAKCLSVVGVVGVPWGEILWWKNCRCRRGSLGLNLEKLSVSSGFLGVKLCWWKKFS